MDKAESLTGDFELPEFSEVNLPEESWGERLLTGLGMGLDAVLLRAMDYVIDAALAPAEEDIPILRAGAVRYLDEGLQRDPHKFFAFVDTKPPPLPIMVSERFNKALDGGFAVTRQFLSNYQRYFDAEGMAERCLENERIPVEHWVHDPGEPRGTMILLHGFTMGTPWIDATILMASAWFERGLDVAMVTLPYHGSRSPRNARFSGQLFASPNVAQLNEAMRQAVHDVWMVTNWVRHHRPGPVGMLGLSLGGYISSLMAGLVSTPDFVIPMIPPVDLADLAWRSFLSGKYVKPGRKIPLTREEHRTVYRLHSPLTHKLKVPKEKLLIIAGRGDRVVPPEHPHALWKHWGEPRIFWFSGSHIAPFRRQLIVNEVVDHLTSLAIL